MKLQLYQIDAFAEKVFMGNPAAVCILDHWLDAITMQQIAAENNLAETAFTVRNKDVYEIRWFTPTVEVALCGHATLATAFVLLHYHNVDSNTITFYSQHSGVLSVAQREDGILTLDFPSDTITEIPPIPDLNKALGAPPVKTLRGKTDFLLIYGDQKEILDINPNFYLLRQLDVRGVIVSAPGDTVDFVSRFFAPGSGIDEDPVTGSAHTTLSPYWAKVLQKNKLKAEQVSPRGGKLLCEFLGERVRISGRAIPYLIGEIEI
ncbi:MAG: PhzF family phenazine biosynthesis protein [Bacteroidota bacterium]